MNYYVFGFKCARGGSVSSLDTLSVVKTYRLPRILLGALRKHSGNVAISTIHSDEGFCNDQRRNPLLPVLSAKVLINHNDIVGIVVHPFPNCNDRDRCDRGAVPPD